MPFYFYDLETSGLNARTSRIMQFGGVRTDDDFKIIDEWETLVTLDDDILPEPDAVMVTGITPQKTQAEGISELEFLRQFSEKVLTPNTTIVGFNNIRFDDEFMRFTLWRNLFDPYEWQWKDDRSRWDMLDVMRMTRALRPEGIEWPFADGFATNRLELLTKANNISHGAHDALADAKATLELAKLVRDKQPKLFSYMMKVRNKASVLEAISPQNPKPFVYTSGQYPSEFEKTTAAIVLGQHPTNSNAYLVYDLRHDPTQYADWDTNQIALRSFMPYKVRKEENLERFPVKSLQINRAPAVAPLGVLDEDAQERIKLSIKDIEQNLKKLNALPNFKDSIVKAWESQKEQYKNSSDAEMALYSDFVKDGDRQQAVSLRQKSHGELVDLENPFKDERLNSILERYIARNAPNSLSDAQRIVWEEYKNRRITEGIEGSINLDRFIKRIYQLSTSPSLTTDQQFLLEELRLYGELIAPELDAE